MPNGPAPWYLGLDLSTQSLTAVLVEPESGRVRQFAINFDRAYPRYGTRGGVAPSEDPLLAHVDPRMWLDALDDMLGLLRDEGLAPKIAAVAVSAQQHGTVYLNADGLRALSRVDPERPIGASLDGGFSRPTAPIWMDSSTGTECREIAAALGGDRAVAELTGSSATERFAGPQIRKFRKEDPGAYARTAHIGLISSFVTSVLVGRAAPVDAGDGYGTNLADIRRGEWSDAALEAVAPDLRSRLPKLVHRDETLGPVSAGLCRRFRFAPEAQVVVGSGDNPCSLVGLGLVGRPDLRGVSLGTSDTYFGYMPEPGAGGLSEGHVFGTADGRYMFLVCFKNGSTARERVRDAHGLGWDDVSRMLLATAPGNGGRILLPHFLPEITPLVSVPRVLRFGGLRPDDAEGNVRAVAEAQAMSMALHSAWTGPPPQTIYVTAGGSENRGLLSVIAAVFGAEVRTLEVKESAALGAALRAAHATGAADRAGLRELWERTAGSMPAEVVRPCADAVRVYRSPGGLIDVYAACERFALGAGPDPGSAIDRFRHLFSKAGC